jgi:tetratricopeptide (TPR) repeat protein
MSGIGKGIIIGGLVLAAYSGYRCISNWSQWLDMDKKVHNVLVATAATTVASSKDPNVLSMESLVDEALASAKQWKGKNTALIFKSTYFQMNNLIDLLEDTKVHLYDIGLLDTAYKTGKLPENAPEWVKRTIGGCKASPTAEPLLKWLGSSELGSLVGTIYEAAGDSISGGQHIEGEASASTYSLCEIMERAAGQAYTNPFDVDVTPMCNAFAHTYFGLIYANMGKLDKAVSQLKQTSNILEQYDDSIDLSFWRDDVKTYTMKDLKALVYSATVELDSLDHVPDNVKYNEGWWKQVQKKAESLGTDNVSLPDLADDIGGKLGERAALWGILGVLGGLAIAGLGVKIESESRYRRW